MTPTIISANDLIDHHGTKIETPFAGHDHTVVYFMRTANCPACNKHVNELEGKAAEFERQNTGVLVIVPDGVDAAGLQEKVFNKVRQSGVFLVDQTGKVVYSHTATLPPMSMNIKQLTDAVDKTVTVR